MPDYADAIATTLYIKIGDVISTVYANDAEKANNAEKEILNTYKIGNEKVTKKTIIKIIS